MPPEAPAGAPTLADLQAQLACAVRECRYRQRVYPRLVRRGDMAEHEARHELATMVAIAETLRFYISGQQLPLFPPARAESDPSC